MNWSLEKFLIAADCQLRLTLTGTLSVTSSIVDVLREKFTSGKLKECPGIDTTSLHDCVARMANIRRRSEFNIPVGTRYNLKRNGVTLSVPLDFVSVAEKTADVFFVSKKKYKGTASQNDSYVCISDAIKSLYPDVETVFIREILLLPVETVSVSKIALVIAPKFQVSAEQHEDSIMKVFKGLKLKSKLQKDLRKCKIVVDPCPARHICPAIMENENGSKQQKGETETL